MADTYQYHVDAAVQLLRDTERLPRKDTDLKRIVVASARVHATLAHAAATREAGDAIVASLDQLGSAGSHARAHRRESVFDFAERIRKEDRP